MTTPLPESLEALVRELAAEYFEPLDQPEAEEEDRLHDFFRRVLKRAGVPELVEAAERLARNATPCPMEDGPDAVDGIAWDDVTALRTALARYRKEATE